MKRISIKYFVLAAVVLAVSVVGYTKMVGAEATTNNQVTGYGWSSNIGWISFDSDDNANVKIDPTTGLFTGYAWSPNIGWIRFNPVVSAGKSSAKLVFGTGVVSGWIRACGGTTNPIGIGGCSSPRNDGWDGWIELAGTNHTSSINGKGVFLDIPNNKFVGYAWGSDVVGWLDFSKVYLTSSNLSDFEFTLSPRDHIVHITKGVNQASNDIYSLLTFGKTSPNMTSFFSAGLKNESGEDKTPVGFLDPYRSIPNLGSEDYLPVGGLKGKTIPLKLFNLGNLAAGTYTVSFTQAINVADLHASPSPVAGVNGLHNQSAAVGELAAGSQVVGGGTSSRSSTTFILEVDDGPIPPKSSCGTATGEYTTADLPPTSGVTFPNAGDSFCTGAGTAVKSQTDTASFTPQAPKKGESSIWYCKDGAGTVNPAYCSATKATLIVTIPTLKVHKAKDDPNVNGKDTITIVGGQKAYVSWKDLPNESDFQCVKKIIYPSTTILIGNWSKDGVLVSHNDNELTSIELGTLNGGVYQFQIKCTEIGGSENADSNIVTVTAITSGGGGI